MPPLLEYDATQVFRPRIWMLVLGALVSWGLCLLIGASAIASKFFFIARPPFDSMLTSFAYVLGFAWFGLWLLLTAYVARIKVGPDEIVVQTAFRLRRAKWTIVKKIVVSRFLNTTWRIDLFTPRRMRLELSGFSPASQTNIELAIRACVPPEIQFTR